MRFRIQSVPCSAPHEGFSLLVWRGKEYNHILFEDIPLSIYANLEGFCRRWEEKPVRGRLGQAVSRQLASKITVGKRKCKRGLTVHECDAFIAEYFIDEEFTSNSAVKSFLGKPSVLTGSELVT